VTYARLKSPVARKVKSDFPMLRLQTVVEIFRSRYLGLERRKFPRRTVIDTAWIDADDGTPPYVCVLWDISEGGARLTVASHKALPDKFILRKTRGDANGRRCVVVWRSPEEIGLKFLNSESVGDL
jgi:PilZ domain-containing protein